MKTEQRVSSLELRADRCVHASRLVTRNSRLGITLIEILISMFVLLFGLMGVAAIFPVASHYIVEGEKRDRGSGLAQIAFEELKSRKILQPRFWLYGNSTSLNLPNSLYPLMAPTGVFIEPLPVPPTTLPEDLAGPGHAFVIDPMGSASTTMPNAVLFPLTTNVDNPWVNNTFPAPNGFAGFRWPVRRITLPGSAGPLTLQSADTIFRLRDDLAVQQPDAGDRPSVQTWSKNDGGTPTDLTDDQLLARQYTGDYSWLATVVPTRMRALEGLQPAMNIKDEFYEVTTVVFHKRDTVPSASAPGSPGSERLIAADFLNSGELAIYDELANDPAVVDMAVDGIKPTNWIAVMGVNQTTGVFMMKWYKILALDDETEQQDTLTGYPSHSQNLRFVMVQGPEWPAGSYVNLRVAILPGAIDAYTRVMQIEQD